MASNIYPHDRRLFREENWPESRWPSFSFKEEIACKETGTCYIDPDFMDSLQAMRNAIGKRSISSVPVRGRMRCYAASWHMALRASVCSRMVPMETGSSMLTA